MNIRRLQPWSAGLLVAAVASFAAPADAQTFAARYRTQVASGVCEPFVPTNQVRYNASGITNAGTSMIYVVCSLAGADYVYAQSDREGDGADFARLTASQSSGTNVALSCTARPGVVVPEGNAQLASTKTESLPIGASRMITWHDDDFGGQLMPNLNFTCALYPGVTIHYVETRHYENVTD